MNQSKLEAWIRMYQTYMDERDAITHSKDKPKTSAQLAAEARARNEKVFVPAKPCKRGHFLRYSSINICVECNRLASQTRYDRSKKD